MKYFIIFLGLFGSLIAKGPPNDNFAKATKLKGAFPIKSQGSLTDKLDRFRATKEVGEPDHAGQKGKGSVWFTWTAEQDNHMKVIVRSNRGQDLKLILAVYTGQSVDDLTLIHRYADFAFPSFSRTLKEPFTDQIFTEFDATKGTQYHFVVDSESDLYGSFHFHLEPLDSPFKPELEVLEPGSSWEYLLATDADNNPVDPKTLDDDFYHTWMFPTRYTGPPFKKGNMPIGYGVLDFGRVRTNLSGTRNYIPPKGKRYTAYLRTQFRPILDITNLGIEGVFDDGAIIYINGREVCRCNINPGLNPQDWQGFAKNAKTSFWETSERNVHRKVIKGLNLKADVLVNVAVSLHNTAANDNDLGTDLRIFALHSEDAER